MRATLRTMLAFLMLATVIFMINCGNDNPAGIDPNDPSTFPGTYNFVSIIIDALGITIQAGQPTDLFGETITFTGTLTLTTNRYTISQTVVTSAGTETTTDTGNYSVSGSNITIDPDDDDPFTLSYSVSGNRLTINSIPDEDLGSISIVVQKQ